MSALPESRRWPAEGVTRVPYWVYQDEDVYRLEQERIFRGATWTFLGLEAELPQRGDWKTGFVGDMPVVVARDQEGALRAFENRCAHRGALLCLKSRGNSGEIACVYHNWTYDLCGNLKAVAFRRGIRGKGGMPEDAQPESQAPRKLRVEVLHGLIFGTLSDATPPVEQVLGEEVSARVRRVMKEPVRVLGGYSQMLQSNWKLYMENVKDTYHASLLHLFFAKFRINRLEQKGGVIVSPDGGSHVSYNMMRTDTGATEYESAGVRTARGGYRLEAPELLESVDEIGDGISLQILAVFPGFVLQQISNCLAVRQVIPKGTQRTELVWTCFGYASDDETMTARRLRQSNLVGPAGFISMEDGAATGFVQRGVAGAPDREAFIEMGGRAVASDESRVNETSVRGLWQVYRRHMGL
ncbi:MAG: Rieske 2Fe-2S domain-containing protein [Betaproteobacteria bacterium]|nr:Rieske 2Fe-2S domain-containing protein [Betaproteobacteria bacterium]